MQTTKTKMTQNEDDQKWRRPKMKTTKNEDDQNEAKERWQYTAGAYPGLSGLVFMTFQFTEPISPSGKLVENKECCPI